MVTRYGIAISDEVESYTGVIKRAQYLQKWKSFLNFVSTFTNLFNYLSFKHKTFFWKTSQKYYFTFFARHYEFFDVILTLKYLNFIYLSE